MNISKISLALGLLSLPIYAQQTAPRVQRVAVQSHSASSYLGVFCMDVDSEIAKSSNLKEERGVLVTKVDSDSPASRAGLQDKDVILEFNTQRVEGTAHFIRLVSETPANRKVTLGVYRNGAMQTLTATIGSRMPQSMSFMLEGPTAPMPPMPPMAPMIERELTMPDIPSGLMGWQSSSLGYTSEPVDGQLAEYFGVKEGGVLVRSVVAKSAADKAGLKAGDVIVKADGSAVHSPREITGMFRRQHEKHKLSLTVVRSHKELTLELIAKNEVPGDTVL